MTSWLMLLAAAAQAAAGTPGAPAAPSPATSDPATPVATAEQPPGPATTTADAALGGFLTLAPKIGLLKASDLDAAVYAGGQVSYQVPAGRHALALGMESGYASAASKGELSDPRLGVGSHAIAGSYSLRERQVTTLVIAAYHHRVATSITLYGELGVGLALHALTVRGQQSEHEETEGSLALRGGAGAEVALGPGGVFVEVAYLWTRVHAVTAQDANFGGLLPMLGYRLAVGF